MCAGSEVLTESVIKHEKIKAVFVDCAEANESMEQMLYQRIKGAQFGKSLAYAYFR
jgi:hypothetical protein